MDIKKLLSYKNYFHECLINKKEMVGHIEKLEEGQFSMPRIIKDETLVKFVNDFYQSDVLVSNYNVYLKEQHIENLNQITSFNEYNQTDLRAILTAIVRGDRFQDGLLVRKANDGTMFQLLDRLEKVTN